MHPYARMITDSLHVLSLIHRGGVSDDEDSCWNEMTEAEFFSDLTDGFIGIMCNSFFTGFHVIHPLDT